MIFIYILFFFVGIISYYFMGNVNQLIRLFLSLCIFIIPSTVATLIIGKEMQKVPEGAKIISQEELDELGKSPNSQDK